MNYLDLFAGAGGLSEGFNRAGFDAIAHVEIEKYASSTLETRVVYNYLKKSGRHEEYREYQKTYYLNKSDRERAREKLLNLVPPYLLKGVINEPISTATLPGIFERIDDQMKEMKTENIDMVIGGPPCQAYSVIGRSRDSNNMKDDPRNYLYKLYIKFLARYKPKAFVFENVPGLLTALGGEVFKDVLMGLGNPSIQDTDLEDPNLEFNGLQYKVQHKVMNATEFGVPQNRKRVIIIGIREDLEAQTFKYIEEETPEFTISDILEDLPSLQAGETSDGKYVKADEEIHEILKVLNIRKGEGMDVLTHHDARKHQKSDLEIYKYAVEQLEKGIKIKYTDVPKWLVSHNRLDVFLDRFKVVPGNEPYCHTVVAHIAKDGHHYIHHDITQNRSLTVREAARLQTFPDDYFFEGPRTANFTQIGNAVPVLMAEKIAEWFMKQLSVSDSELIK
jgi:DNA (cytosine-5)-methyltransferase 1